MFGFVVIAIFTVLRDVVLFVLLLLIGLFPSIVVRVHVRGVAERLEELYVGG